MPRYAEHLAAQEVQDVRRRAFLPPFTMMLAVAFSLHVLVLVTVTLLPDDALKDVPFKMLNIRLGGGTAAPPAKTPPAAVKPSVPQPVAALPAKPAPVKTSTPVRISSPVIKREPPTPPVAVAERLEAALASAAAAPLPMLSQIPAGPGSPFGSPEGTEEELIRRYEQILSQWIEQHKLYPLDAQQLGREGKVLIRIRIDRQGRVLQMSIERPSGSELLDLAALESVRRSNPLPAVPFDYPGGAALEFLVPIQFVILQ